MFNYDINTTVLALFVNMMHFFFFGCQMPVCSPLFTYQSRFKMNKPIYLKILYNDVLLYDKFIRLKSNASRKS